MNERIGNGIYTLLGIIPAPGLKRVELFDHIEASQILHIHGNLGS